MRTGQFATKHRVSPSTVAFYLKAGLLTPRLAGGKYEFDADDDADMEQILTLKEWRFSLEEIADILSERRLTKDSVMPQQSHLYDMLKGRREALEVEAQQLRTSIDKLTRAINEIDDLPVDGQSVITNGIDVRFLPFFFCPLCHTQLSVRLDCINNGQFSAGELNCSCGYRATVSEGVLENSVSNQSTHGAHTSDPFELSSASAEVQNCFYRMYECLAAMLHADKLSREVVIETHTGYSSFLLQKARVLPDSALYICCDPKREILVEEKHGMDNLSHPLSVLFLASNNQRFPLRSGCAQYLVSCLQGMFFTDTNGGFPFQRWTHYLEPGGCIVGAFIDIASCPETTHRFLSAYPHALPEYYDYRALKKSLQAHNFALEEEHDVGGITSSAFTWHKDGDELRLRCYRARLKTR